MDLQNTQHANDTCSVSDALTLVKNAASSLGTFKVVGEISGYRGPNAKSGHVYFQLKDATSAMDTVMWRGVFSACQTPLSDGLQVEVIGKFDVYAPTGKLSFIIQKLTVAGEGLLRQQVAELAKKLQAEGLMNEERKKAIPFFCEKICVITSLSGAVIDDVKQTLNRRNPLVKIYAIGAAVQGEGAAKQIIAALKRAQDLDVDAILLVRGGGSFEDLMTFNDENLARTIAASAIPVVTGIGHEPDTSIADMVSDRRMSTPTAAAESIAPDKNDLLQYLLNEQAKAVKALCAVISQQKTHYSHEIQAARRVVKAQLATFHAQLTYVADSAALHDPFYQLHLRQTTLLQTAERLLAAQTYSFPQEDALVDMGRRLSLAQRGILDKYTALFSKISEHYSAPIKKILSLHALHLDKQRQLLVHLNPLNVLDRGYAIVKKGDRALGGIENLSPNDSISVVMCDGKIDASVVKIQKGNV